MNQVSDPIIGRSVLGRYRVVARLAAGGMGVVYLARAEGAAGFAKPMVVKRILPEHNANQNVARLFVREAKILANLQHPNIVGVTDFGEEDGAYIMVLDYVRAYHLGLWLAYRSAQGQKLPIAGAIYIMCKVLDALEYAHTLVLPDGTPLDIIHSDISPSNILIDTDGHVKLLDFGIARMRGESTKSTERATIRGKLAYLPLEALDGSPPGVKTDVYAAGVTLYELIAGNHPYSVDDDTVTIARVISHEPPPISTVRPEVPPELDAILARAMSKSKDARYASAKDFARELRRIQPIPEDEVAASLSVLVKEDFSHMPDMPELGAVSLAELEEAWRNPAPTSNNYPRVGQPRTIQFDPTLPPEPASVREIVAAPPPKKSAVIPIVVVSAVVLGIGLVAVIVILLRRPPDDDKVVNISVTPNGTETILPAGTSSTVLQPLGSASTTPAGVPDAGRAPPPRPALDPLTATVIRRQGDIDKCVQTEAPAVNGAPSIDLKFTLADDGAVQKVDVVPASLAGVPVGQCIVGVAKSMKFPAGQPPPGLTARVFTIAVNLKTKHAP